MDENQQRKQELERIAAVLKAAMREQGLTNKALASHLSTGGKPMHESMVSQWVTARKPIAEDHAPKIAALLNLEPSDISEAYRQRHGRRVLRLAEPTTAYVLPAPTPAAEEATTPDETQEQTIRRLDDQIYGLNLVISIMAGVMVEHRPIEAKALADQLHKRMPQWLRDSYLEGLLKELDRSR